MALKKIATGHRLETQAANSYTRMVAARGKTIPINGTLGAYRTKAQQKHLYDLYKAGKGNLAARPGTSVHESGRAADFNHTAYAWLEKNASRFGWVRTVPSERWHYEYHPSRDTSLVQPRGVLRKGSVGSAVRTLQSDLNRVFPSYSRLVVDGAFGPKTETVIKEFQRRSGLVQDGLVGPLTKAALAKHGVTA